MTSEKKDFKQTHLPHRKLLFINYNSLKNGRFLKKSHPSKRAKGFIQQMTHRSSQRHKLPPLVRPSQDIRPNIKSWNLEVARRAHWKSGVWWFFFGDFWWENVKDYFANRWDGLGWVYVRGCKLMWFDVGWCFSICLDRLEAFSPNIS